MFTFLSRLFKPRGPAAPPPEPRPDDVAGGAAPGTADHPLVLRRAVLARDKRIVGYEFFPAEDAGTGPAGDDGEAAYLGGLASVVEGAMLGQRRAFTVIPSRLLSNPLVQTLAKAGVIPLVRFEPEDGDLAAAASGMQAMHDAGLRVGLADARTALAQPALGHCADVGFLPVDQIIPPDLLQSVRQLAGAHPRMRLCASGVQSQEEFEVCRRLHMHGFIGPFMTDRRDWQNKAVDPGTLRLCKLVNSLRAGAEMDAIIHDIKLDPLLSYRILCHANSAAIGAQRKILALKDAIMLIGREPLFRWLVLLLCASAPSGAQESALLESALVRGRTMELLAGRMSPVPHEDFFLTGVLSLLDVILQVPAPALLEALDLPEEVRQALLAQQGPYADLLRLAQACEDPQAQGLQDLCTGLGITPQTLSEVQAEALVWARGQAPDDHGEDPFTADPAGPDEALAAPPVEPHDEPQDDPLDAQRAAAQLGDPKAQWGLAVRCMNGEGGLSPDTQQAAEWCGQAAAQGFAPAQAMLGRMYAAGQGVDKDIGKALALLEQAAQQGDIEAQYNLAVLHEQGQAGAPDMAQALAWFSKAADLGLPAAQERLGLIYATGQAVAQDLVEAYKWFWIASQGHQAGAKANLAHSQTLMSAEQISEGEARAQAWLQNHAATHPG